MSQIKKRRVPNSEYIPEKYALSADTTEDELLNLIKKLNADDKIHGILVQLPLPEHLDDKTIINNILPSKDVDAFHPTNVGRIMIGDFDFVPCTPAGIMELIHESGIEVGGKECVVIGRSNIVGKPMSMLLLHENGTVTVCHSKTSDLKAQTAPCRYFGCRGRYSEIRQSGYGKARGGCDRCRHGQR